MNEPDQKVLVIPRLKSSQEIIEQWWSMVNINHDFVPTAYSLGGYFYEVTGLMTYLVPQGAKLRFSLE